MYHEKYLNFECWRKMPLWYGAKGWYTSRVREYDDADTYYDLIARRICKYKDVAMGVREGTTYAQTEKEAHALGESPYLLIIGLEYDD